MARRKNRKLICVIPAAGLATRTRDYYYYDLLPKALYPVAGKPILEYQLQIVKKLGINKVIVVVNPKDKQIPLYLKSRNHSDLNITTVAQGEISGLGGAILSVSNFIKGIFVLILGDDITIATNLEGIIQYFKKSKAVALQAFLKESNKKAIYRSCGLRIDKNNVVTEIKEKPRESNFDYRGIGIYILSDEIFDLLRKVDKTNSELRLTDALELLSSKGKLVGFPIDGVNFNINTIQDIESANKYLLNIKGKNRV